MVRNGGEGDVLGAPLPGEAALARNLAWTLPIFMAAVIALGFSFPFSLYRLERERRKEHSETRDELRGSLERGKADIEESRAKIRGEVAELERTLQMNAARAIDRQSGRHEERLFQVQMVINSLWERRAGLLLVQDPKTQAADFSRALADQHRDTLALLQVLQPGPEDIFTGLGTLLQRKADLPRRSTTTLIRTLERHGRLRDPKVWNLARELMEELGDHLSPEEAPTGVGVGRTG